MDFEAILFLYDIMSPSVGCSRVRGKPGVRGKNLCLSIDVLKSEEEVFYIGYTS